MLDSFEFKYEPYKDGRVVNRPSFTVGMSGPLLMATHKATGKKYIVKHTCPHNVANEYVACWLAERMEFPRRKRIFSAQTGYLPPNTLSPSSIWMGFAISKQRTCQRK